MEAELRQLPQGVSVKLGPSCVIGRSPEADLQVDSTRVSREHAMIRSQSSGYWIYDLGSANGTAVNDKDIEQPVQLQHRDVITMADIVFQFHVPEMEGAAAIPHESPAATVIGVRNTPVILLVTDIVDFSGLSEKTTEEELASILNLWYDDCRALMDTNGGTIDKFMGDGMFGYWKQVTPEARANAVRAARRLVHGPPTSTPEVRDLMEAKGIQIRCGVGLHIGTAALGSVTRGTKTALGDVVNIAFRIESLTRNLGYPILASADFFEDWEAGRAGFTSCGPQDLKGYSVPMELYGCHVEAGSSP